MNQEHQTAEALWDRLVDAELKSAQAFRTFFSEGVDRVPCVRRGMHGGGGGMGRSAALRFFPYLTLPERKELFPDLVFLASVAHGSIQAVRDLILALPRDWVIERIEREAEPLLQKGDYEEYRRFLELYQLLDADMTQRLARRAAAHADPDVREAGEEYLAKTGPALPPRDPNDPLEQEFLEDLERNRREDRAHAEGV